MNKENNVSDDDVGYDVDGDNDTMVTIDSVNKEVCMKCSKPRLDETEEVCCFVMKYNGLCWDTTT